MFGKGLVKGLQITWKEFWAPKLTVQYPEVQHTIPERFHGKFVLDVDKCIACGLCANACPNRVIDLKKQKVGKKQFLTDYVMNIQYCMYCGMCVESCNKDALHFSKDFNMNQYFYRDIPLVLVRREAPAEPVEEEAPAAKAAPKPKPKPKAKAEKSAAPAAAEVAAGKAPGKEGQ
ncbi:4Fe-4S dicluster domain-containing protein [Desulfallas thermosapovorans]|uniref:NADH-quinone oxidoreductase subunit I n=1 Tax=Desulfallas thermosapovorans DSM 6562 TaxID=1121431 RepID=A0A5S4ZSR0_9FIRM|nr:4Fe-4S dicluster domain-containing protein [Desulfallas thermosapovorans]TYO95174.1 NADH-quinone oxidoreductase subunit I [Desulfallas thermosapovorans DSM 6562]